MTPDLPGAPPPASSSLLSRELAAWLGRLLLWSAGAMAAFVLGGALALYGLAGVVLAVALALVAVGALAWRRAMLPLALCAAALAGPAAIVAGEPERVNLSGGQLVAAPTAPDRLAAEYRRGRGPVILDLRHLQAADGATIKVRARSDADRVVVALPQGRCFNLRVRAQTIVATRSTLSELALLPGLALGVVPNGNVGFAVSDAYVTPDGAGGGAAGGYSNLVAFGRSVAMPTTAGASQHWSARWERHAADAAAPTLDLDLAAAGAIYVRDYPDEVGVAFDSWYAPQPPGQQVSDVHWPEQVQLPPSPSDLNAADAYGSRGRTSWHATREAILWRDWFRRVAPAAMQQSRRAAGTCATFAERAQYWTTFGYGEQQQVSVNGNGLVRRYTVSPSGDATRTGEQSLATYLRSLTGSSRATTGGSR